MRIDIGLLYGRIMKTYFKILSITLGLQVLGYILFIVTNQIIGNSGDTRIPNYIGREFLYTSTALGIALPLVWYDRAEYKFLGIIFLPTNYTLIIITIIRFLHKVERGLNSLHALE